MRTLILDHGQILQKINRLAWQLYENHADASELVLVSIAGKGEHFAGLLKEKLESIAPLKIIYAAIQINKQDPLSATIDISAVASRVKNNPVVIVDDVLNTGRTLVHILQPFLDAGASTIQTVILADRDHKNYPVHADYVGISLATTLHEHITFDVNPAGEMSVYLD